MEGEFLEALGRCGLALFNYMTAEGMDVCIFFFFFFSSFWTSALF